MAIPNRWRATAEEIQDIEAVLHLRKQFPVEDRERLAPAPEAADASWEGGFRYALKKLWQDQPGFMVIGIVCGLVALILN